LVLRSSLKERGRVKALVTSDLGCLRPCPYRNLQGEFQGVRSRGGTCAGLLPAWPARIIHREPRGRSTTRRLRPLDCCLPLTEGDWRRAGEQTERRLGGSAAGRGRAIRFPLGMVIYWWTGNTVHLICAIWRQRLGEWRQGRAVFVARFWPGDFEKPWSLTTTVDKHRRRSELYWPIFGRRRTPRRLSVSTYRELHRRRSEA